MFKNYKQQIIDYLTPFLNQKSLELSTINSWGPDFIKRLIPYLRNGKMIRGSLVLFAENIFQNQTSNNGLIIASSIELINSGILIHDDIIDNDLFRRGQPSFHQQYKSFGLTKQVTYPNQFGDALGICSGSICSALCFELLNIINATPEIKQQIINLISKEIENVYLAEMQDVYFSLINTSPTETEILDLYRTKTGRYTCSMPLMLGAIITYQNQQTLSILEKLGENLGILFQIKDDELGLFGTPVTGKPIGTDISRANKTLYYYYLFKNSSSDELKLLKEIFGKINVTAQEIEYVKNLTISLSIDKHIAKITQKIETEIHDLISKLSITQTHKNTLLELVNFIQNRNK
ncbi:MAG: Geranylgeranyl pyrophosphate synthase [Candidatus Gottesmanbacteria bacterium GW2011_GWA1_34_13]|uniref:Geranylgeranyl pyrophosphate synthase n=1 Tax=Candidatus Gottesmanbacteria bacterium GW2011_GWA1_34_13 TaxID=1618434 RepID=A0A0G0ANW6_9BACT|nr:MAG: Geranylgeranyl pyrophosphate synthase [Candidatus Gottesmanbacteria bacterium GW2011_GWA1_34_13]